MTQGGGGKKAREKEIWREGDRLSLNYKFLWNLIIFRSPLISSCNFLIYKMERQTTSLMSILVKRRK